MHPTPSEAPLPSRHCRQNRQSNPVKHVEGKILILGEEPKLTPWQRFVRLQRRARLLSRGKGFGPGVFRFNSHEELREWTLKNRQL